MLISIYIMYITLCLLSKIYLLLSIYRKFRSLRVTKSFVSNRQRFFLGVDLADFKAIKISYLGMHFERRARNCISQKEFILKVLSYLGVIVFLD